MTKYIILIGSLWLSGLQAQNDQGTIVYNRKIDYTKIIAGLPYLSDEEKDRVKLTWGTPQGKGSNYNLTFDGDQAVYTYGVDDKESNWSWRKDEFLIIEDLKKKKLQKQFVLGGRLYLLDDAKPRTRWKIENEIREVAGYLCMKAVTQDQIKGQTIEAWFTDQLPTSAGPEGYGGLPGMILMLNINDGTSLVEATSVVLEIPNHPIPKKIKGKNLSYADHDDLLQKFFADSIEGERNPYWDVRY